MKYIKRHYMVFTLYKKNFHLMSCRTTLVYICDITQY